jgi:hypothetical protein
MKSTGVLGELLLGELDDRVVGCNTRNIACLGSQQEAHWAKQYHNHDQPYVYPMHNGMLL